MQAEDGSWVPASFYGPRDLDGRVGDLEKTVLNILRRRSALPLNLRDLRDCDLSKAQDGHLPAYSSATGTWQPIDPVVYTAWDPRASTDHMREAFKRPGAAQFDDKGMQTAQITGGGGGAWANGDDADGPWITLTTNAAIDAANAAIGNNTNSLRAEWNPDITVIVKAVSVTDCRLWVGWAQGTILSGDDPAQAVAAFRYATDVDTGQTWRAYTNDGAGGGTVTNTSVAIATAAPQKLRVALTPTAATFSIDNVIVATHTTNLPTINFSAHAEVLARTAAAKTLKVARFAASMKP